MLKLSQQDRDIIAKYPLKDGLDFLRDKLSATDKPPADSGINGPQKAISLLLAALMGHEAAYNLESKDGSTDLASELSKAFTRIRTDPFNHEYFRPLSLLVIEKAADTDIWEAVFALLSTFAHTTPPPSSPASWDDTPVTRSSSSFQGSEQTRRILDPALFYEIQHCTYRNVDGFFEKYFESKSWERRSKVIFSSVRRRTKQRQKWYDSKRWTGISDEPTETEMWNWLSGFQAVFLSNTRGIFHAAKHTKDLNGAEAKRQIDVLIKKRAKAKSESESKHDWKDVQVVGELKQSAQDFKPLLLQLSRYARDIFTAQPTRRFVHAFTLQGRIMELWAFDRSGPYSSGEFDIHNEPTKFIKTITGYANMSDEELGLDTYIEQDGTDRVITIRADAPRKGNRLRLEKLPFVKQRAIVCRGTTCFRTSDQEKVLKFSWTSDQRPCESELLRLAHKKGVEGVARFVRYEKLTTINELRSGMTFPAPHRFRATIGSITNSFSLSRSFGPFQKLSVSTSKRKHDWEEGESHKRPRSNSHTSKLRQECQAGQPLTEANTSLYETDNSKYSNRTYGCLAISPAGRALSTFTSINELLTALRDAIKGHRSLYIEGRILHRDISENNVIITDPASTDGFTGLLIDLDLAKIVGSGRSGARHQTGTVEFMAIQVLQKAAHTYRHDLESFFYVLIWICARRVWEVEYHCSVSDRPKESRLRKWYTGTFEEIAEAKQGYMHADGFKNILKEFLGVFDCVKPLCRKLRAILFPLRQGELDTGTYTNAQELYSNIIEAYNDSLATLELETKS